MSSRSSRARHQTYGAGGVSGGRRAPEPARRKAETPGPRTLRPRKVASGITKEEAGELGKALHEVYHADQSTLSNRAFVEFAVTVTDTLRRCDKQADNPPFKRSIAIALSNETKGEVDGKVTLIDSDDSILMIREGEGYLNEDGEPRKESTWYHPSSTLWVLNRLRRKAGIGTGSDGYDPGARIAGIAEAHAKVPPARRTVTNVLEYAKSESLLLPQAPTKEGQGGPEEGAARRGGGIGSIETAESGGTESSTAPQDADSGADEAMYENHDAGSEEENDDGPNGFIKEEVKGTKAERDVIAVAVENAYGEDDPRSVPGRRMLAHVYDCQTGGGRQYEDGVPIDYRLIQETCREAGLGTVSATSDVWWPLVEAGHLCYDDYDVARRESREFSLTGSLRARLQGAVEESYDTKTRYDLVSGSRRRGATKTTLTYDGEHSWKEKSEFIHRALKALKGQRDLVNAEAVEDHLKLLRGRRKDAKIAYRFAKKQFYRFLRRHCDVEKTEDGEEWSRPEDLPEEVEKELDRLQKKAYRAGREYERAKSRSEQDHRIWSDIKGQGLEAAPEQPNGIYAYETAYEVQEKSGRLTMLVGLQNASEEMKAAACKGILGYKNVDIKSSQTNVLIEEMELANEMGADLDVSAVRDAPDKELVANHFGLGRDAPKTPEHGGKFGAMFAYDTFREAKNAARGRVFARLKDENGEIRWSKLHRFEFESGEMAFQRAIYNELPTMARVAQDWADEESCKYNDPGEAYQKLKEFYKRMTEEIDKWRSWLVDEHWELQKQEGGDGYYVTNPCGLPFDKTDYDSRYEKKAAYATSRLQGREAAYMLSLAILAEEHGYEYLRNEHDGAVVLGEIPDEAREKAREMSGFHRAELEEKPFDGDTSDTKNTEDEPCDTTTSKDRSAQDPRAKRSRSATSPSAAKRADGSAGGTAALGGVRSGRTPSGSPQPPQERSETTSGTTCRDTAPSDSSTESPGTSGSNRSSGKTTGTTSRASP